LAKLSLAQEDYSAALKPWQEILAAFESSDRKTRRHLPNPYTPLLRIYKNLGRLDEAIAVAKRRASISAAEAPSIEHAVHLEELADLVLSSEGLAEAVELLQRAALNVAQSEGEAHHYYLRLRRKVVGLAGGLGDASEEPK